MRKLNITFEIEDNDFTEFCFLKEINQYRPKHVRTLPNTDHLKDDETFKKLRAMKRNAQLEIDRYVNNNRL